MTVTTLFSINSLNGQTFFILFQFCNDNPEWSGGPVLFNDDDWLSNLIGFNMVLLKY